ncbi:MAG: hypothetical protein KC486_04555, partial [Myxococcales bacterium]|nr:hypothetical protein [Myxococcales bacterium]
RPWPEADPKLLVDDTWTLVVQIMGKKRAQLEAPQGASKDEIIELALGAEEIAKRIEGKTPRRVIYVPNKLVNIVL